MNKKIFLLLTLFVLLIISVYRNDVYSFLMQKSEIEKGSDIHAISKEESEFKNIILIGWDGVQRNHLNELLKEDKLPNFKKYFLEGGSCAETVISTGETSTKPGWAEILTGYGPPKTGVLTNTEYGPIPKGYTIFERLEEYFGDDNITTLFISGKKK